MAGDELDIFIDAPSSVSNAEYPILMIGGHTDNLSKIDPEKRLRPAIASSSVQLSTAPIVVDTDKFGLIYLNCESKSSTTFTVTISGAIDAPYFKLGRDTLEQWQETIRHHPAPRAELEGNHSSVCVPSSMIRELPDPQWVIKAYDGLVYDANRFVGFHQNKSYVFELEPADPVRFILDIQTELDTLSHDGNPIVFHWSQFSDPYYFLDPITIKTVVFLDTC